MKKNNKKITTLAILAVAVVGLSIGFAAFSNVLTISSGATVTPDASTFNVDFSAAADEVDTTTAVTKEVTGTGVEATDATIDNSTNPTIKNLKATFTEPGQKVVYTFYAYNAGEYTAYLNAINFINISGESTAKKCTAKGDTTQALVDAACNAISVTVKAGDVTATTTNDAISGKSIAKGASHTITVTIEYAEKYNSADSPRADGEFDVTFGDISLTYGSVD